MKAIMGRKKQMEIASSGGPENTGETCPTFWSCPPVMFIAAVKSKLARQMEESNRS